MGQLEVKYGLFEPARLWVTKNGISKDFYDPEDLQLFLDSLQSQSVNTTTETSLCDHLVPAEVLHLNQLPREDKTDATLTTGSEEEI
ncbi:hypothetical protein NDU88_003262 [Pleurodeles waltl]|uniref:Uncharacterized protein n=1 Tax=Pleurodeles waltl TaxID=8319 RepID=A0AAV7NHL9_PLEWA|nr:hypothetical protein NDU88_003262 [Pleurodeles waltl]